MLVEVVVVVGCCAYNGALRVVSMQLHLAGREKYSLAIDVQVDLRVVGREDAVGGSDNWAGSHGVCCCAVCGVCV